MRAVNLLPRQQVEQAASKRPTKVVAITAAAAALLVVVVLSAGFLLASRSVDHQRQALTDAKAQLAATAAPKKTSAKTAAQRMSLLSNRERRALALASALSKRVAWDRVLREITLVLPDDVWLASLNGTTPLTPPATAVPTTATVASAIPAAPSALTLQGYTYSQDGVARLLSRLAVVPDLKNVQLQSSKVTPVGRQNIISFTIVSDIRTGKDVA
jgi:Tfp pilus assembly protein PilN